MLATIIGAAVGASTAFFLNTLEKTSGFVQQYSYYFLLLPVIFYINYLLVKKFPDIEGHGTEKVIYAIHKKSGKIRWQVVPLKLITTVTTLAFGGSAGKEGPCAQIGGGIAKQPIAQDSGPDDLAHGKPWVQTADTNRPFDIEHVMLSGGVARKHTGQLSCRVTECEKNRGTNAIIDKTPRQRLECRKALDDG